MHASSASVEILDRLAPLTIERSAAPQHTHRVLAQRCLDGDGRAGLAFLELGSRLRVRSWVPHALICADHVLRLTSASTFCSSNARRAFIVSRSTREQA